MTLGGNATLATSDFFTVGTSPITVFRFCPETCVTGISNSLGFHNEAEDTRVGVGASGTFDTPYDDFFILWLCLAVRLSLFQPIFSFRSGVKLHSQILTRICREVIPCCHEIRYEIVIEIICRILVSRLDRGECQRHINILLKCSQFCAYYSIEA